MELTVFLRTPSGSFEVDGWPAAMMLAIAKATREITVMPQGEATIDWGGRHGVRLRVGKPKKVVALVPFVPQTASQGE